MLSRTTSRSLALGLAVVTCAVAREAAACFDIGDPCRGFDTWNGVQAVFDSAIPTDGMVLLQFFGPADMGPTIDLLAIEVTLDGSPVAGVLEAIGVGARVGWRPAAPLAPSRTYVATGSLHNPEFEPNLPFCGEEFVPFMFEFTTASGPMPPLVAPEVFAEEKFGFVEPLTLEDIVCCDGAFPYRLSGCGGSTVDYNEGFCVPLMHTGRIELKLAGTLGKPGDPAPMVAAQVVVDGVPEAPELVFGDFVLRTSAPGPVCTEVALRNFVTGATVSTMKQCHGQGLAGQLGPQVLEPNSPVLADNCVGGPYVCEVDEFDEEWDPDRCMTWPEGQGSTGEPATGGPTSSGGGSGETGKPAGTGTSGESPGGTSTSGTTTGAATNPVDEGLVQHGCACANARGGWPDALAGLLVLAGLGRRRRRDGIGRAQASRTRW